MSTIAHSLRDYKEPSRELLFCESFGLPSHERVVTDINAVLSLQDKEEVYAGRLSLTQQYLTFASVDRRTCRMSLPLYTVRRVERLNSRSTVYALSLVVWHGMKIVSARDPNSLQAVQGTRQGLNPITFGHLRQIIQLNGLRPQCEAFCAQLRDNLRTQLGNMKRLKPFLASCFSEFALTELAPAAASGSAPSPAATPGEAEEKPKGEEKQLGEEKKEEQTTEPQMPVASAEDGVPDGEARYLCGLGAKFKFPGDPRK